MVIKSGLYISSSEVCKMKRTDKINLVLQRDFKIKSPNSKLSRELSVSTEECKKKGTLEIQRIKEGSVLE
jgi:hypothetical protein